jgi:hypothetical protein
MLGATSTLGEGISMPNEKVFSNSYRLIPSHFPPITFFEKLLDPSDLEAAYALESMTNDRLQDEVGNIQLVSEEDRVSGYGTSVIMAAFTHIGVESRFTKGLYGVYYAGLEFETALSESKHSRSSLLKATDEEAQILTMRCYKCIVDTELVDLRSEPAMHDPDELSAAQAKGESLRRSGEYGALYNSVRKEGGQCVAIFRPKGLTPPAVQTGHYQYHWDGEAFSHVLKVEMA